jgi:hypothetical protein
MPIVAAVASPALAPRRQPWQAVFLLNWAERFKPRTQGRRFWSRSSGDIPNSKTMCPVPPIHQHPGAYRGRSAHIWLSLDIEATLLMNKSVRPRDRNERRFLNDYFDSACERRILLRTLYSDSRERARRFSVVGDANVRYPTLTPEIDPLHSNLGTYSSPFTTSGKAVNARHASIKYI